ncbi:flagellar basal-body MS-ring/collar protein FliF [Phaeovulum sp. NW3]|uniref:flagellar basal-body MS-ring/collar protein FliF n=1 Tax=Phaeovulum sp. NW3 TaxID=2934933 RepID=UPI00201FEC18|nr:flagellar basal-body MS-ring/collar protein FliF [Phaeovulum sp. NW3]MCL7466471.1 flagellar M-ring protein FliF [Phaeovulum sp. NW3]
MQQFTAVWHALDTRRRLVVAGATLAMFAAILALSSVASRPTMALLYAGLEGARAGEVVAALEQRGAAYEVRGDSIYVEAPRRDELRMTLASEGLPATGGAGYELLDSLSGFGTTSQMFDAAYWRAKEGELARTIVSNPAVKSARVHIARPSGQAFRKDHRPTASVFVTTASGGLSPAHAKALKFLVASAVAGMSPDDVSVIDGQGGLIATGDDTGTMAADSRAAELKRNVQRLLEARVGYGNAVVEVALETVTDREAITERRFDPEGRVVISTDTEESSDSANDTKPGAVTVASNLPEGDGEDGGKSQSQSSQTRERTNYEVSETKREILKAPGAVKRITVAVLVDGIQTADANGNATWEPRPDAEMEALRELVASAVGFDESRGDVITLRSMPFEPIADLGSEATTAGIFSGIDLDVMSIIQLAVLAAVALVLGLFVMRPILMQTPQVRTAPVPPGLPGPDSPGEPTALSGEIADGALPPGPMTVVSDYDIGDMPMSLAMDGGFGVDDAPADPVSRLKRLIEERQSETVEILRSWMEEQEERT